VINQQEECIKALLASNAKVMVENFEMWTPLQFTRTDYSRYILDRQFDRQENAKCVRNI